MPVPSPLQPAPHGPHCTRPCTVLVPSSAPSASRLQAHGTCLARRTPASDCGLCRGRISTDPGPHWSRLSSLRLFFSTPSHLHPANFRGDVDFQFTWKTDTSKWELPQTALVWIAAPDTYGETGPRLSVPTQVTRHIGNRVSGC